MKLIIKQFGKILKEISLEEGGEYFIGRHENCDFVVPSSGGVSRKHIKIYYNLEQNCFALQTLSEWGDVYLDGQEVQTLDLDKSQILSFKDYTLEFVKEEELTNPPPQKEPSLSKSSEESTKSKGAFTKTLLDSAFVYSLYVSIEGEFSDHISLNEGERWTIGRSEECDISIDYDVLTRKHLEIVKKAEQFYIKDLGSANKTLLNGKELASHKQILLKPNDEVKVFDLKIVFEVRSKNYDKIAQNLPASIEEDSKDIENLPELPFPKVVLEEVPAEENEDIKSPNFLNKKKAVIFAGVFVLLFIGYFQYESSQKKKKQLAEQMKEKERISQLELFYNEALANKEEKRYQLCITQIEELHLASPQGYFKDSQSIINECRMALKNQRQKEEMLAQEEKRQATQKEIQKVVTECQTQYKENKIITESDLDFCAKQLLEGLDPENAEISAIRMEIGEKRNLKLLEEEKKQAFQNSIQAKRNLYNRAKRLQGKNQALKAVAAYNKFLKSAKNTSALKSLYEKAKKERDEIQKAYDDELNRLYSSCENLMKNDKMKEAYYDCKKILKFRAQDEKAKRYIAQAKTGIRKELKSVYEESMLHESFSRIKEARKLWLEIVEKDIPEGYYYKKAQFQIKKYE